MRIIETLEPFLITLGLIKFSQISFSLVGVGRGGSEKPSLVPRPVRAIRVTRGGLEPSAGDVTSEIAEDDWERGWGEQAFTQIYRNARDIQTKGQL